MLLLVVSFGAHVKVLWFCWSYQVLFCRTLQKLILNLIKYLNVLETCMMKRLKTKGGCDTFFNFLLKMTSWACLLRSRLKLIFHWKTQSLIFFKLLFSSFAEVVMSCVKEKKDVSSANNFALEDRSPEKLFMYIKNNTGPKKEPWGTPAVTFRHSDVWPLRITLCFLSLKKLDKRFKRLPDIPCYR